jgi:hypothetical protein
MLPSSGQTRSGTRSRVRPLTYCSSSPNASSASVSWAGGKNHFAATLASSTHVLSGSGPLVVSLRKPGNWPMNPIALPAVFAHAPRIPSVGPILSLLECSPPVELALQPNGLSMLARTLPPSLVEFVGNFLDVECRHRTVQGESRIFIVTAEETDSLPRG